MKKYSILTSFKEYIPTIIIVCVTHAVKKSLLINIIIVCVTHTVKKSLLVNIM